MADTIQVQFFPDRRHVHSYRPYNTSGIRFVSLNLTQSWGAAPGQAVLTYLNNTGTLPPQPAVGLRARIDVKGNIYWMILMADRETQSASGSVREAELSDYREYLKHDYVFCAFNMREDGLDEHGKYRRRYWHVLPENFNTGAKHYTPRPYTARQILDEMFRFTRRHYGGRFVTGLPGVGIEPIYTIETEWERQYHRDLELFPVYNLNWLTGETLGSALTQISNQLGLVFTLNHQKSAFTLQWVRKGEGRLPVYGSTGVFPMNSFNRRTGIAFSGAPTRIRVIGGRNRYQVLDLPAVPSWNPLYQQFVFNQAKLVKIIYDWGVITIRKKNGKPFTITIKEAGDYNLNTAEKLDDDEKDTENVKGWLIAGAQARTITLAGFDSLQDRIQARLDKLYPNRSRKKLDWLDNLLYKGQSRNNMPVWIYLRNVVFKAFKVPAESIATSFFNAKGNRVSIRSCEVGAQLLRDVSHDYFSGIMRVDERTPTRGDGYAVIQGYAIDAKTLAQYNPDRFDNAEWLRAQNLWQEVPFDLDPNDGTGSPTLLFGSAIIKSRDLFDKVDEKAVIKAKPTFTFPAARVCLSFDAEYLSLIQGVGGRDKVASVPNLKGFYVTSARSEGGVVEVPLEDGVSVGARAAEIAQAELRSPVLYHGGGYTIALEDALNIGSSLGLSSMFDRININISASGSTVQVDFTKERQRNTFVPERELDHAIVRESVFPGYEKLKEEVNDLLTITNIVGRNKNIHDLFSEDTRGDAKIVELVEPTKETTEETEQTTDEVQDPDAETPCPIPVGSPVWKRKIKNEEGKAPTNTRSQIAGIAEDEIDAAGIFMGCTLLHEENAFEQSVRVISLGDTLARVMGPVAVGDAIGKSEGNHLVAGGDPVVGFALEDIEEDAQRLINVRLGTGAAQGDDGGGVWK